MRQLRSTCIDLQYSQPHPSTDLATKIDYAVRKEAPQASCPWPQEQCMLLGQDLNQISLPPTTKRQDLSTQRRSTPHASYTNIAGWDAFIPSKRSQHKPESTKTARVVIVPSEAISPTTKPCWFPSQLHPPPPPVPM